MELTPLQAKAVDTFFEWYASKPTPFFYLTGYAGTGKTTLARFFAEKVKSQKGSVAYAAFTGKASLVLERKKCTPSSTIHRLMYKLVGRDGQDLTWEKKPKEDFPKLDLLILDECSMINEEMGRDLLSYGVPILVLGDPGQLPPVEGTGFFTAGTPDFHLTEIHRQAEGSPIINLATQVRNGKRPAGGFYGPDREVIITGGRPSAAEFLNYDQILCGTNHTRTGINRTVRTHLGRSSTHPLPGDKLICLKNNWEVDGMMNGSLWKIEKTRPGSARHRLALTLTNWDIPDQEVQVETHLCFFDQSIPKPDGWKAWKSLTHFTYGYAITVHKSQGSQWDNVLLFDESAAFRDDRWKHLYTGVTRAAERLTVII